MNGAESLIRSFTHAGVNVCFANPGTSEMHLVQAIDAVPEMRAVLALFEGVCTGAADGYGRMMGVPATTLLHLGPGFANGIANLHNARRANSPIINLIGNHTLKHVEFDTPLTSDIDTLARNVSSWIKSDSTADSLAKDGMSALRSAATVKSGSSGNISTMIIPADACWSATTNTSASMLATPSRAIVDDEVVKYVAGKIDAHSMILLDNDGLSESSRIAAGRISTATGCRIALTTFPARFDGGPGSPVVEKLPYFPEAVLKMLSNVKTLILAGAEPPASFFAYPGKPSSLVPEDCEVVTLARSEQNTSEGLESVADLLKASNLEYACNKYERPQLPTGKLNLRFMAATIAHLLPDNAIMCSDSGGGGAVFDPAQNSVPNTWLNLTGGSIGQGGPVATGAAVACPDRRVLAVLGDGATMYTNQSFWTQAREGLDVTTIVFNNQRYGILETEYFRLGVDSIGARASNMFNLVRPTIDYVALAGSMGVPGREVGTCEELQSALVTSFSSSGPFLIDARI